VGLGTWFLSDWDGSSAFVDLVKQSRPWNLPNWNAGFATVDALGWPTEDASTVLASYPYFVFDTYKLVFNGKATVTPQWFTGTVTNQVYNAATNTTTADVNVTGQGDGYINLIFTNTQRTGSSATGTGFTNAHLYRPGYPTDGSVVFTTPFLTAMGKVSTIRMMDWTNTNSNYIVNWADRTTPLSATQAGLPNLPYTAPDGTVYNGNNGIALEYQILLCNTLMVDCYFNIPVVASDDFVNKMALAIAFGTDGTNPYSSPQTSAVFPPLNPSLRIYLEYANEVWNSGAGVFHPVESICEELPADHPLVTVDGNAGIWGTMWRYPAWRMATVSQTFASVFGSAAMMTRVRPLLETQQGDGQATLATALQWLNDYAPTLTPASTIPELLYGGGGSGYYGPINANSADPNVYLAPANYPDPNALLAWGIDATWTYNYGIKHVAYEGGPGLPGFTRAANDLLNADPRMETMMDAYQTVWDQQGGDVLVYYTVEGPSQWEFTPDITDSTTPKFDALADIQAAPRAAVTLGAALPGTMLQSNESQYRISSGELWDYASTVGGESCLSPSGTIAGNYFAYPAHAATAFTGTLTVSGSASSNTQLEVWINGVDQGSVSMAAESNTSVLKNSTTLKVGIPEGLSVIRMYYTSGNMTFCGLTVTNP
jgi:hypothetical protein